MEKLKRAVIKEEFVALTGDMLSAVILNQFLYWAERTRDIDKYIEEEINRAKSSDDSEDLFLHKTHGWIYKSVDELKDEVMATVSIKTVKRRINDLIEAGWIETRENPKYKWDKTKQYRPNLINIYNDLKELGYHLQGYKFDLSQLNTPGHSGLFEVDKLSSSNGTNCPFEEDKMTARGGHSDRALPEITTETTSEIKKNKKTEEEDHLLPQKIKNFYESEFKQSLNNTQEEKILEVCDDTELIYEAMKVAKIYNAEKFSYILTVLKDWKERGVKSKDDFIKLSRASPVFGIEEEEDIGEYYREKGYR